VTGSGSRKSSRFRSRDLKTAARGVVWAALLAGGATAPGLAFGQTPGQSVNMVSGTTLPGGDPYLQRQNEPSLAVSTRNPQHLLAGANDYRTVDMPGLPDDEETGDSWVGLFSSLDGGATWRSTLVPGYPQDGSPEGLASPVKGLTAAADPVVRAGTHGLFYYGFIAFDREAKGSRLAVARFVDLNDRENGDIADGTSPIRYVATSIVDSGNSGQFVDKPWLAVDVPRPGGKTCLVPTSPSQSVPGGMVYMAWARFTGVRSTKVMLSRSLDCGTTWSRPLLLSESDSINQGLTMAIDPASGDLYVAWRRVATPNEPAAIVLARSSDLGLHFTRARPVVPEAGRTFAPFDQSSDPAQVPYKTVFRTTAYPALAVSVDAAGQSRVHVAWAQRVPPRGDARIVLATSADRGATWTAPRAVDDGPLRDDFGGSFDRGHQLMPQMTSAAGRLLVLYYDTRLDHTRGILTGQPGPADPSAPPPAYQERREPQGALETPGGAEGADLVFTPVIDDALTPLGSRRHTIDVRVAQLDLRQPVDFAAPVFTSARVSQYPFGITATSAPEEAGGVLTPPATLTQLAFNPPNLPLFAKGSTPFVGDYIDIAGLEFVRDPSGEWRFNAQPASAPVFHAVWTSNQDVRPPPDGDWTSYTPPGKPGCVPGREGMRNQNVYTGRITEGLVVSSPQTSKALKPYAPDDPSSVTTFVVEVQNRTADARWFRLRVAGQPASGRASLVAPDAGDTPREALDTLIPALSGASHTVFAASSDPVATIPLEVAEIAGPGGDPVPGGLSSFLVLNADPTEPLLVDAAVKTAPAETQAVTVASPAVSNPSISNPSISNPSISNPSISNPSISNPSISNPSISNPSISNPSISNPSISNPSISNESIAASPVSDATYPVKNRGATSGSYRVKVVGDAHAAPRPLRLLVTKVQSSPASVGCDLVEEVQTTVLLDVVDPAVEPPADEVEASADNSAAASAASPQRAGTFALRPGETAYVTLRAEPEPGHEDGILAAVAPVVIPEAGKGAYVAPLMVLPAGGELPPARYGVGYSAELRAFGGKKPYSWAATLPAGLAVDEHGSTGVISGAPLGVGRHDIAVRLVDASADSPGVTRRFVLDVGRSRTRLEVDAPSVVQAGVAVPVPVRVVAEGEGAPTGAVFVEGGDGERCSLAAPGGTCTLEFHEAGERTIKVAYEGDESFEAAGESEVRLEVVPAARPRE
jgi:hypothetical protein